MLNQDQTLEAFTPKEMRLHNLWMDIAERISQMSYAQRKKVGCVAVKDGRIISSGWNGTPYGFDNTCEEEIDGVLVTKKEVLHAELNMYAKIAASHENIKGADIYVTLSPCMECSKLIMQTKIKRVFFKELYRDDSAIVFLEKAGVEIFQMY